MTRPRATVLAMVLLGCGVFFSGGARVWAATPVSCASPASAQPEPTEYFVSLADPAKHLARVSIRLRNGEGTRTLAMPVWNALYQVRNFAANVEREQQAYKLQDVPSVSQEQRAHRRDWIAGDDESRGTP